MNTFIVQADSKVSKALIAIFKAMNVSFEMKKDIKKEDKSPYDPEFVKKILEASQEKQGIMVTEEYKENLFQGL
jgi:hypothetical protein